MRKDIGEIKHVVWNTFHMVEDIKVRVGDLEEALHFNQEEEDFGSSGEISSD